MVTGLALTSELYLLSEGASSNPLVDEKDAVGPYLTSHLKHIFLDRRLGGYWDATLFGYFKNIMNKIVLRFSDVMALTFPGQ